MWDYFSDESEEEALDVAENGGLIAKYFGIEESEIEKYLAERTEEQLESSEGKAYKDDEFVQDDCWQMVDFMRK